MNAVGWIFGLIIFTLGLLNIFLVHPVPGLAYILVSMVFPPPVNIVIWEYTGFSIPFVLKVFLFLVIIWFTLGISDLGEMAGF